MRQAGSQDLANVTTKTDRPTHSPLHPPLEMDDNDDESSVDTTTLAARELGESSRKLLEAVKGGRLKNIIEAMNEHTETWINQVDLDPDVASSIREACLVSYNPNSRKRKNSSGGSAGGGGGNGGGGGGGNGNGNGNQQQQQQQEGEQSGDDEANDNGDATAEAIAAARLATLQESREHWLGLREDRKLGEYKSVFAFVKFPSMMKMAEERLEDCFHEYDCGDPHFVDVVIGQIITDFVQQRLFGMQMGRVYRQSDDVAWKPICFRTIGQLGNALDEDSNGTSAVASSLPIVEGLKLAAEQARDSGIFSLPSNQSADALLKQWLTMDEPSRNYNLVMLNCLAGCYAFRFLELSDLTEGDDPILSDDVLDAMGVEEDAMPSDANELLVMFRLCFDDGDIDHEDKVTIMLSLLRIIKLMKKYPDSTWKKVDGYKSGSGGSVVHAGSDARADLADEDGDDGDDDAIKRYFTTTDRKNKALLAMSVLVCSDFIYDCTRESVLYGQKFKGVLPVMLRCSIDSFFRNSMYLMMRKVYDGSATEEYMTTVHEGLNSAVTKANAGSGRGQRRSTYADDVAILTSLGWSKRKFDKQFALYGFELEEAGIECSEEDSDSDSDEEEDGDGGDKEN